MRIAHISLYPPRDEKHTNSSGVSSYAKNLITNTPYKDNDEIFVLCNKINNKYEEYVENNIKIIRCFDRNPAFIFQLGKEIKKIAPGVVHIQQELSLYGNTLTAYLLQWFIFFLRKYRTIITLHGVVSLKSINKDFVKENNSSLPPFFVKVAFYLIYKPLCLFTKKIIVHEDIFKQILINEYKIKREKIYVIYHGIEDLKCMDKNLARDDLMLDRNKNIILFLGYLTGYKGVDLLIEGFSIYSKINPDSFLIIGAGKHPKLCNDAKYLNEYSRIENKAKELIPVNQYRWVGFIEESNIISYFSASDVSVYPYTIQMSSSGPMSMSIGYEKPFLASVVFDNFIENKNILFKQNKECLADALKYFFNNKLGFVESVKNLKIERSWSNIGNKTYYEYEK